MCVMYVSWILESWDTHAAALYLSGNIYINTFVLFCRFRQRRDLSQQCLVFRLRNLKAISASGKNMHKIFYLLIHPGGGSSRKWRDTLDGTRIRVNVCVTVTGNRAVEKICQCVVRIIKRLMRNVKDGMYRPTNCKESPLSVVIKDYKRFVVFIKIG